MFFCPEKSSVYIMCIEKQFVVDFISTLTKHPFSWEFDLLVYDSEKEVELNLDNIKIFSKLYQQFNLDDGSRRDLFIADLTSKAIDNINIQPTHKDSIKNPIEEYIWDDIVF